jgi:hypothetical protein
LYIHFAIGGDEVNAFGSASDIPVAGQWYAISATIAGSAPAMLPQTLPSPEDGAPPEDVPAAFLTTAQAMSASGPWLAEWRVGITASPAARPLPALVTTINGSVEVSNGGRFAYSVPADDELLSWRLARVAGYDDHPVAERIDLFVAAAHEMRRGLGDLRSSDDAVEGLLNPTSWERQSDHIFADWP